MTQSQPVRLGTVGFGIMGERLMRAALDHDPAAIVVSGAWDPSPAAIDRLKAALPGVTAHASLPALLQASDCVHIASPPDFHLEQMQQAVDAGLAVLCEKPLATDVPAAQRAVAALERQGARAAVNFPFASSFAIDQLAAWRAEGAIGAIRSVAIEIDFAEWPRPWQRDAAGWLSLRAQGGFTREVASHFLFLCLRQLGPLALTSAKTRFPDGEGCETSVRAELVAGGVPVSLVAGVGGTDKPDHNLWVVEGEHGAIRLRDWAVAERRQADGRWMQAADARPNEEMRPLILKRQLDKVAAMSRGMDTDLASLREALDVQQMVERILKAVD